MKAQFTYESHPSDPKRTVGTFPSLPHLAVLGIFIIFFKELRKIHAQTASVGPS